MTHSTELKSIFTSPVPKSLSTQQNEMINQAAFSDGLFQAIANLEGKVQPAYLESLYQSAIHFRGQVVLAGTTGWKQNY